MTTKNTTSKTVMTPHEVMKRDLQRLVAKAKAHKVRSK